MEPELRPSGSLPGAHALLEAARAVSGVEVSLIAVDMPLSRTTITGRRTSDAAVSRAYGGGGNVERIRQALLDRVQSATDSANLSRLLAFPCKQSKSIAKP